MQIGVLANASKYWPWRVQYAHFLYQKNLYNRTKKDRRTEHPATERNAPQRHGRKNSLSDGKNAGLGDDAADMIEFQNCRGGEYQ